METSSVLFCDFRLSSNPLGHKHKKYLVIRHRILVGPQVLWPTRRAILQLMEHDI